MIELQNFLLNVCCQALVFSALLLVVVMLSKRLLRSRTRTVIVSGLVVLIALWFAALVPIPNLFESWRLENGSPDVALAGVTVADLSESSGSIDLVEEHDGSVAPLSLIHI